MPCWDLYWKCDKFSRDILRYDSNFPKLHGLSSQEIHEPSENEEVWEKNVIRGMFGTLTIIPVLSSNNCLFWWWKLVSLWYPAATRIVNRIWRTDSYHSFCRYFTPVIMNFFPEKFVWPHLEITKLIQDVMFYNISDIVGRHKQFSVRAVNLLLFAGFCTINCTFRFVQQQLVISKDGTRHQQSPVSPSDFSRWEKFFYRYRQWFLL